MKEQLLLAWLVHESKNTLLLQHLTSTELSITSSPRSRTIGQQLAHMHNVRLNWTQHVAKPLFQKDALLTKETALTPAILSDAFHQSAAIIHQLIEKSWENGGGLPSFTSGLIPFVSYLISHESHHRGQVLLILKQSGFKIPENLKWGLWEWASLAKER